MRYDRIRRVLVVLVAGLLFLPTALFSQQQDPSPAHSVHLSSVTGVVTVKRPGATEAIPAHGNALLEEGSEVSTSASGSALIELENGSTIQLNELTKASFTHLSAEANGREPNTITLEQGQASFHFLPKQQDTYQVKIADATVSPQGKAEFQTAFSAGKMQVRVAAGSVIVSAHSGSMTLGKGKFIEYRPSAGAEVAKSHARVVRLSYLSGTVTVTRPGSTEAEKAMLNTPIQEGFELSTAGGSYAEVEFENGSTARVGEQSKLLFHQLALDADGNKLNGMTFEQGYATFHFLPEHSSAKLREDNGAIRFEPTNSDVYHVKIADATLTAAGKCEFRTDMEQDHYRVEVFSGAVDVASNKSTTRLGEGKILEHNPASPEMASNIQKGIVKDAWDQWTEARDKQVLLTEKDEAVRPNGPSYGWSDLNTYGEWVTLPGGRFGWSPYSRGGWSPYTNGMWNWYPGMGWAWISGEPWGWVTDHCGLWDFDDTFGWYWMNPMFGCGFWNPALVDWYGGPGWIGWQPTRGVHPRPLPPHRPHPVQLARGIVTVPTAVLQSRQVITPDIVSHALPSSGTPIEHPTFEPSPRPAAAATAFTGSAPGATGMRASSSIAGSRLGFASQHGSAPPTILMGGDPASEGLLLSGHHFLHADRAPLRAAQGATLGGRYALSGSPGEFRGNASAGGGRNGGAGGVGGRASGPIMSHSSGGSGVAIASHGSSGGGSGGGGSSGGGHSTGGGGGMASGGGGSSSSAGHSGGGGSAGGGGGGGHH